MIRQFREDGFLAFDTGISERDIQALRETLSALHDDKVGFKEGAAFDAMGVDDGSAPARFPQILHPRSFAPELIGNSFYQMAQGMAEQLLGSAVRFKADYLLMKPARIGDATPGIRMRHFRIRRSTTTKSASGWRCSRSMKPIVAWLIFRDRIRDRCCRTGSRAAMRVSMRWNASADLIPGMPCPARCRRADA